jgi:hypothetical protein
MKAVFSATGITNFGDGHHSRAHSRDPVDWDDLRRTDITTQFSDPFAHLRPRAERPRRHEDATPRVRRQTRLEWSGDMSQVHDPETDALIMFLDAQRASVLAIADGLPEKALRARILPSGWTPLGLIEHLGHAERHWFQDVATGSAVDLPWPDEEEDWDPEASFDTIQPVAVVFAFYRDQCERANAVLAATPLSTPPRGRHNGDGADEVADLRWIALHMIEETARHAGHLDIVRELLDGETGLGPR